MSTQVSNNFGPTTNGNKKQVLGKGMAALLGQLNNDLPSPTPLERNEELTRSLDQSSEKLAEKLLDKSSEKSMEKNREKIQDKAPLAVTPFLLQSAKKLQKEIAEASQAQNQTNSRSNNTNTNTNTNTNSISNTNNITNSKNITQQGASPEQVTMLETSKIQPNTHQPRKVFNSKLLEELAQSIKENGIIQPLIVNYDEDKKSYYLIAGERRFRAAKMVGLAQVPVVVKQVTQQAKLMLALIENIQRSDLNCVEEALAYFQLMEEFKLTQEEVAKKVGKERSTVANFLRLLKLPKEVILLLQKDILTFGHAKLLGAIKEETSIAKVAQMAVSKNWSVRDLELYLKDPNSLAKLNKDNKKDNSELSDEEFNQQLRQDELKKKELHEKMDMFKQKLQRKTGMHIDFKTKKNGSKGMMTIKFESEAELNDIIDFMLKA